MPSKLTVELLDRGERFRDGSRHGRRQEAAEELVEPPMLASQGLGQGLRGRLVHLAFSELFHAGGERIDPMPLAAKRVALTLLAGVFALACRKPGDPVRETLDRIVDAANRRDAGSVVSQLAAGYRDAQDQGPGEVAAVLRRYFAAYEILNVRITGLEIERAPEAARAR